MEPRHTIWAKVMNWPGYYISVDGDIHSTKSNYDGREINKWKRLQLRLDTGYVTRATLSNKNNSSRFSPQQLVGMHFPVGGYGKHINHKNGIRNDNRVENLEWCSPSENERHSWEVLGKSHSYKSRLSRSETLRVNTSKLDYVTIVTYEEDWKFNAIKEVYKLLKLYSSIQIFKMTGIHKDKVTELRRTNVVRFKDYPKSKVYKEISYG